MKYKLAFKESIEKDLKPLSKTTIIRVLKKIIELQDNPQPSGVKKLRDSEGLWRIRVGDYRIIYEFDNESETIEIFYIRHRKDVYRNL